MEQLSTSLEVVEDAALFHVDTADTTSQSLLSHLGFTPSGGIRFSRGFDDAPSIVRIHQNFAQHLEEILQQVGRPGPVPWDAALREFLRRMEGTGLGWWLSGSAALAVRGIDVTPGDVDLVVEDAQAVGGVFEDALIFPVDRMEDWAADWYGAAFCGAIIEWVAGVHPDTFYGPGPHEASPEAASRLETVNWEGHAVQVTPLDLQLAVAEERGLDDRVAKISAFLARRKQSRPH